jgi:hypothetical protein
MFRCALRIGTDKLERVAGLLAAALVGGFALTAPVAAHAAAQPIAVTVYTMSPGRLGALWAP